MDVELILFAKAPLIGQAKTRLAPRLGERGAARLAAALIAETVRHATAAWPGPVRLLAWPDAAHPCFEAVRAGGVTVGRQAPGDLGAKMYAALQDASERGVSAAILGCDVPQCPAETLRAAHAFLAQGRAVIGPSVDGGYYLIGMSPPRAECFEGLAWGSSTVYDTTLTRAAGGGLELIVLQQLNDIDVMADLDALRVTHPELTERLLSDPC